MFKQTTLFFIIAALALLPNTSDAQEDKLGNWLMYFGTNRVADQWSIHSEVQYRSHTVGLNDLEQLLLRTGLNYHLNKNTILTAGYANVGSYAFESNDRVSNEHRLFQQLILFNQVNRLKFEHRYRFEQRWVSGDYKSRLRYRLMVFLPLNKPTIEPNTFFLGVYNEIFMNTKQNENQVFFDRNRFYTALGYQINKTMQIQVGYLYQRVNKFGKDHFQLAWVYNPDFRKKD